MYQNNSLINKIDDQLAHNNILSTSHLDFVHLRKLYTEKLNFSPFEIANYLSSQNKAKILEHLNVIPPTDFDYLITAESLNSKGKYTYTWAGIFSEHINIQKNIIKTMTEQFFYEEIICNDVAIHSFKVQHTPDGKAFGPFHVLLQENYIVTGCLETIEAFLSPPAKENKYSTGGVVNKQEATLGESKCSKILTTLKKAIGCTVMEEIDPAKAFINFNVPVIQKYSDYWPEQLVSALENSTLLTAKEINLSLINPTQNSFDTPLICQLIVQFNDNASPGYLKKALSKIKRSYKKVKRSLNKTKIKEFKHSAKNLESKIVGNRLYIQAPVNPDLLALLNYVAVDNVSGLVNCFAEQLLGKEHIGYDLDKDNTKPDDGESINTAACTYPEEITPDYFYNAYGNGDNSVVHPASTCITVAKLFPANGKAHLHLLFTSNASIFETYLLKSHAVNQVLLKDKLGNLHSPIQSETSSDLPNVLGSEKHVMLKLAFDVQCKKVVSVEGETNISLPTEITHTRLTPNDLHKPISFAGNRVELKAWNKASLRYYMLCKDKNILSMHPINKYNKPLHMYHSSSIGGKTWNGYERENMKVYISGTAVALELVAFNKNKNHSMPFQITVKHSNDLRM